MPGVPRTPLVIFQKKMSLEMASKEGCDLQAILWAHCHLSHPSVLSVPSLRCQDSMLTSVPRHHSSPGHGYGPKFMDTGTTAQKK